MYLVICYSSRGRRDRQAKASCLPGVRALRARLTYPTNGVAEIDSQPAESEQYRGLRWIAGVGVPAGRGWGGLRWEVGGLLVRPGVAGLAAAVLGVTGCAVAADAHGPAAPTRAASVSGPARA